MAELRDAIHARPSSRMEAVVGWRTWRLAENGLSSLFYGGVWPAAEPLHAECQLEAGADWPPRWREEFQQRHPPASSRRVPSASCECGIYAVRASADAREYAGAESARGPLLLGRVALWGRVLVAERGWRAEYAYPQSLFVPDELVREMRRLLARYRVPIIALSDTAGG